MVSALKDTVAGIRENAIRLAESRLSASPALASALIGMTGDSDPRVRFSVLAALGFIDSPQAAVDLRSPAAPEDAQEDPDSDATAVADASGEGKDQPEKGKPVRVGSVPFNEQIRAAKATRDPVLARIMAAREPPPVKPIV